jgi:integrase
MADSAIKTWGQGLDYTFQTRHSWRHGNGSKTARINTSHFTRLRGRSFPLSKITSPVMAQVTAELEDEQKSDATINRIVSAVSTVLNHLAFEGLIDVAPRFRRRKENEHRLTYFTKEEVEQMAAAAIDVFDRQDLKDIILFAAYTAGRQGEILKLTSKDIDLSSRLIHFGGRPDFITKAGNYRSVPVHDRLMPMLTSRLELVGSGVRIFGDEWRDKDQLLRAFKKVRNFIGKDESYVFHSLRHSFATWAIDANVGIRIVQELLGHKTIETTLRYAKVSSKARNDAIHSI